MEAMQDHLEGRAEKYDTEYRIRTASGEYRWFHDVGGVTERRRWKSTESDGCRHRHHRRKTVEQGSVSATNSSRCSTASSVTISVTI